MHVHEQALLIGPSLFGDWSMALRLGAWLGARSAKLHIA